MTKVLRIVLACFVAVPLLAQSQVNPTVCGGLANGDNGPFDYRTERGPRLKIVEEHHFNAHVEALLSGQTGSLAHDIDYVLRAFPNHHRALVSVSRLTLRNKGQSGDPQVNRTAECYFERALRFRPDDTVARVLLAQFLQDSKRTNDAALQLDQAIELGKDNPFTQYNIGLVFADMGMMDRAMQQAHRAMSMGFQRSELRERIKAAGKWQEPAAVPEGDTPGGSAPVAASAPDS